jgi:hypothetical protein
MLNKFGLYKNYSIGTILFFFSSISIPFANIFFWMIGDTLLAKVLTFIYLALSSSVTAIAFMLGLSGTMKKFACSNHPILHFTTFGNAIMELYLHLRWFLKAC